MGTYYIFLKLISIRPRIKNPVINTFTKKKKKKISALRPSLKVKIIKQCHFDGITWYANKVRLFF